MTPEPREKSLTLLYFSIIAVILSFLPFICIAGIVCGINALKQANREQDIAPKVLAIIAIIVGALVLIQSIFMATIIRSLWF